MLDNANVRQPRNQLKYFGGRPRICNNCLYASFLGAAVLNQFGC